MFSEDVVVQIVYIRAWDIWDNNKCQPTNLLQQQQYNIRVETSMRDQNYCKDWQSLQIEELSLKVQLYVKRQLAI